MAGRSSLRETLSLAHSAQCKLHIAANRPDRNLRFVLGHALTLDNLTLRLVEIEDEMAVPQQPSHATGIKIKAPAGTSTTRKRSPPPSRLTAMTVDDDDDDGDATDSDEDDGAGTESDDDELELTRFPSAAAQPHRHPAPAISAEPPPLDPSDESSSSDEEEELRESLRVPPSDDVLRSATKGDGDDLLMSLYSTVKKCPCHGHHESGPQVQRMWDLPAAEGEKRADGVRFAIAEVSDDDA